MKKLKKHPLIIILLIIVILPVGITFSKFVIDEAHEFFFTSKDFYFTSNRLKEDGATYTVDNWSGTENIDIQFALRSSKNDYLVSDYDVEYEVTYTCGTDITCSMDNPTGIIYVSNNNQTMVSLTAVPGRAFQEGESTTIHVEAKSKSPYVKTISADFVYSVSKTSISYNITDTEKQAYMLLSITNAVSSCKVTQAFGTYSVGDEIDVAVFKKLSSENQSKCVSQTVTISFNPNDILFDNTSSLLSRATTTTTTIGGVDYINSITFTMNALTSVDIKFYKVDINQNYSYTYGEGTSIVNFSSI